MVGFGVTLTTKFDVFVHPLASVTVTVQIVVLVGFATGVAEVISSKEPSFGAQLKLTAVAEVAVKLVDVPSQIVVPPVVVTVGGALIITSFVAVELHVPLSTVNDIVLLPLEL